MVGNKAGIEMGKAQKNPPCLPVFPIGRAGARVVSTDAFLLLTIPGSGNTYIYKTICLHSIHVLLYTPLHGGNQEKRMRVSNRPCVLETR